MSDQIIVEPKIVSSQPLSLLDKKRMKKNTPKIFSGHIYPSYELGKEGGITLMRAKAESTKNPIVAFACVVSYFAGTQETIMKDKMDTYEEKHEEYKTCLNWSKYAHRKKAEATANNGGRKNLAWGGGSFKTYINSITGDKFDKMDKGKDKWHNKDEWQAFIDVINKEKDIQSTDLNKLSTEMDMAVKDCSEAEQMAANAVKKATDLMSTQGRTAGG